MKKTQQILDVLDKAVNYASVLSDEQLRTAVVLDMLKTFGKVRVWSEKSGATCIRREGGGTHRVLHDNRDWYCTCTAGQFGNKCWAIKVAKALSSGE